MTTTHEPDMSDAQFTNVFSIMIGGLTILTIGLAILANVVASGVNQSDINAKARDATVAERIEPAGQIAVGEVAAASTTAAASGTEATEVASGETVYQQTCVACHGAGVAGAPTFGDAGAWADRIAQGIDTLYQHAIEGFQGSAGMMPAKGGNVALSDEAIKAAVDHMVEAAK